jgi:pyruvate/2-oxoglutarate dehydrogenase complex dihydrolipoamide dehydrogenase (E3) component
MSRAITAWDLIVVGGGTAGIVAAKTAAGLGARVLLVEKNKTGGDCLWTGCVPSKSLLAVAHVAAMARSGNAMGVFVGSPVIDFPAVMNYVHSSIREIAPQDSAEALQSSGVSVLKGEARFVSAASLTIEGEVHSFRKAVVATGAVPVIPPIPGLRDSNYLTFENIWELNEIPQRLVIVGAGSIGCELGQAFQRLGSEVTLIDGAERILPREDSEASAILYEQFVSEGIDMRTSVKVLNVATDDFGSGRILFESQKGVDASIDFDRILIAVGRSPRTHELGLDVAGIKTSKQGYVVTTASLRTTNRNVWAAGDVTGHPQFTHVAGIHGSTAASNAILGLSRKAEVSVLPRVTFTDPEIAAVGVATTVEHPKLRVLQRSNREVDRAITESKQAGTTKIVVDKRGKIVGGLMVGPRAGESLAEITMAIRQGLTTRNLASTVHPYPTYGDGLWNIAIADVRKQLATPQMKFALRILKSKAEVRIASKNRGMN